MNSRHCARLALYTSFVLALGCGGSDEGGSDTPSAVGGGTVGGATASAGAAGRSGTVTTGGTTSGGATTSGTTSGDTGGLHSMGGVTATGGRSSTGGGDTGGLPPVGGVTATGGRPLTGGTCATTYFRDGDDDGWGTGAGQCEPGGTGRWVPRAGDCHDDNADVHPEQTRYFSTSYTPARGTVPSFDYDCDGEEESSTGGRIFDGSCEGPGGGNDCSQSGYLPADEARSGAGVDLHCGSDNFMLCQMIKGTCAAVPEPTPHERLACR